MDSNRWKNDKIARSEGVQELLTYNVRLPLVE